MAQHFLLSTQARTLSLAKVLRLSDEAAWDVFKSIRWASTEGAPVCPRCGSLTIYELNDNRRFKCADCAHKFSVTSGTIFASRKLPIRDLLAAIAIFVNGAKGHSALQLSRDLDVQYKTAFVLAHKNHSEAYSLNGACTNWAESFFSRIRRAEVGIHHHISGRYLAAYAQEMAWREDNRRVSNGEQYLMATGAALAHPVSRVWKGYWQRSAA